MLGHLYDQGVHGKNWQYFENFYSNISSRVKWKNEISNSINEGQGIRQGGKSSANCFKAHGNKSLSKIEDHPSSLRIGCIQLGAVMVADDLAVMSDTARGLQYLVLEPQDDASRERYTYNATKTKVQVVNKKQIAVAKENLEIYLNNTIIQTSD